MGTRDGWLVSLSVRRKRNADHCGVERRGPRHAGVRLFCYSQVRLNKAGVASVRLTPDSKPAKDDHYGHVGGGAIIGGTSAMNLMVAKLASLPDAADQLNSTQHFLRELNRFGVTSLVDAGARVADSREPQSMLALASRPRFPMRISHFLTAQNVGPI
jgi:predicted amidohydrolase YtcJ